MNSPPISHKAAEGRTNWSSESWLGPEGGQSELSCARAGKNSTKQPQKLAKITTGTSLNIICKLLTFIIAQNIITNLINHHQQQRHWHKFELRQAGQEYGELPAARTNHFLNQFPTIILLADAAAAAECTSDNDCGRDKSCHENKCICMRDRPIEVPSGCVPLALFGEQCDVTEQCLGNSQCIDGICSCGNEKIALFNPSAKLFYCHPKRGLNEECNYDSQCPLNAYCSTVKAGCLCQNGFAEAIVSTSGQEMKECLPKFCAQSSTCESEFHECEDNKCKCLATHFDPHTAKCYRFGSTGGKLLSDDLNNNDQQSNRSKISVDNEQTSISNFIENNEILKFLKDLTENGDKIWLVLIILITLSLCVFILIFILLRKYYLGYCWTAHKKEYEPNNDNKTPKNGYFDKNSINNKSFRQKSSGEVEQEGEANDSSEALDESNLVKQGDHSLLGSNGKKKLNRGFFTSSKDNNYVKVNMADDSSFMQQQDPRGASPLSTSTSTPV